MDPVHGLNVSEKVTVPTFKVMAEVDKYFELSSHPRSGAMVIHSVEEKRPSTVSHITGCHACETSARRCGIRLLYGAGRW
jgi:hypothetical protein